MCKNIDQIVVKALIKNNDDDDFGLGTQEEATKKCLRIFLMRSLTDEQTEDNLKHGHRMHLRHRRFCLGTGGWGGRFRYPKPPNCIILISSQNLSLYVENVGK